MSMLQELGATLTSGNGDDVKPPPSSSSANMTTIKQEPPATAVTSDSAARVGRTSTLTSSASMPIIITPRSLGQHSTSSDDVSAGYAAGQHQPLPAHNPLALSQHIELMSLNSQQQQQQQHQQQQSTSSALPPYASAHDVMTSIGDMQMAAHSQYMNALRFGAATGNAHYEQLVAQDMRTGTHTHAHYASPSAHLGGMSQLALRRGNIPAPLDSIPLNMVGGAEHLNSPGPGSCSGSHPPTPSHPVAASHQMTPHPHTPIVHAHTPLAVQQQQQQQQPPTPGLPYTPSLAQTPSHPLTPHTPSQPCTPGHVPQTAQHFQVSQTTR